MENQWQVVYREIAEDEAYALEKNLIKCRVSDYMRNAVKLNRRRMIEAHLTHKLKRFRKRLVEYLRSISGLSRLESLCVGFVDYVLYCVVKY